MAEWQDRIVSFSRKPAHEFLANPQNARRHPAKQREALRGSLDTIGWASPVIISAKSGFMLDGHARVEEALSKDENTLIPVIEVDLEAHEESLFLASFDYITYLAEYDRTSLDALLHDVQTDDTRLQAMLSELANDHDLYFGDAPVIPDAPEAQIDRAEELNKKWQVKSGDLWIIPSKSGNGIHKLLCGDSTKAEDVSRLMGDDDADAVVTDSPYGMDVDGVTNDSEEGLETLLAGVLDAVPFKNCVWVNFQGCRLFPLWVDLVRAKGQSFHRALWMYKPNDGVFPYRGWLQTGQIILLSSIGKPKWGNGQEYKHDTYVLNYVGDELEKAHATPKPVEVIRHLIEWVSHSIVYDPFGGSGTTMVACEQLARQCRMIEIEPKYCAVILERMQQAGLSPELEDTHATS